MDERYRRFRAWFYDFKTVDEEIAFLLQQQKAELRELGEWLQAKRAQRRPPPAFVDAHLGASRE